MKTISFNEREISELEKLINNFDQLYQIENWTIDDLDEFREIGSEIIQILKEKINFQKKNKPILL